MKSTIRGYWREFSDSAIAKHSAGLGTLVLLLCALLTQLAIDWNRLDSGVGDTTSRLGLLRNSTAPLRGASDRLARTRSVIEDFSVRRIPVSYSQISSRIVEIGMSSGIQLSHTTYDQRTRGASLSEVSIESQIRGTYPQIMRFVNGLERDQTCFVIRAMTLTGQQGGEVNLQLRFSTWLRPGGLQKPEMATASLDRETSGVKTKESE